MSALPQLYGGAVGDDLGGPLHHGGRAVTDVYDGVRAQGVGLVHHALGGDLTGLDEHLRVAGDLAAYQGLHPRHEVLAEVLGLDDRALYDAKGLDLFPGYVVNIEQQHLLLLLESLSILFSGLSR